MPSDAQTRNLVNADRLAKAKKGIRITVTRARDLIDEGALADASGGRRRRRLDVFTKEPTVDHRLQNLPQVGHASHRGVDQRRSELSASKPPRRFGTSSFGVIRNARNSRRVPGRVQVAAAVPDPERLGSFLAQMKTTIPRSEPALLRRPGQGRTDMVANAVIVGLFRSILSTALRS
jgi:D-3-phosphoglycerate dehydrogenase